MDAVGPAIDVALGRQIALLPTRMLLGPRLPRLRGGRLLRRATVDADRLGASVPTRAANASSKSPVERPFR
jgi:hypothetical protein